MLAAQLEDINKQLTQAQADRFDKESRYELVKTGKFELLPEVNDSVLIAHLKEQRATVQGQYVQAANQYGPKHPKLRDLKKELDDIKPPSTPN